MFTKQTDNRLLIVFIVFGLILALSRTVNSAGSEEMTFPNRNIEIVVPTPPGGLVDVPTRLVSEELSRNWGVPVVVVNKPGAGGIIAAEYVARAKPDGYTMLSGYNGVFTVIPAMRPKIPYKTSDFIPVARFAVSPLLLVVRKETPWKTLEELIAYAKANPGKLACGSAGVGTVSHFNLEFLKIAANVDILHAPAKGGAPMLLDLVGGHVDFSIVGIPVVQGLVRSGKLRALASTGNKAPGFPEIPTLAEKGYPEAALDPWVGAFVPKGVEKPVLEKISKAFEKIIKTPEIMRKFEQSGYQIDYMPGEEFAREIEKEFRRIVEVLKKTDLIGK